MQSTADETLESESDCKRARFRNLIQLIRLTTTILNKGSGPKLQPDPDETAVTNPYASGPYTYLDATARLLVRKDEVIAAAECTSLGKDSGDPTYELAVMAHSNSVPVVGFLTFYCGLLLTQQY